MLLKIISCMLIPLAIFGALEGKRSSDLLYHKIEQLVQGGVLGLPIDDIIGPSTFGDILGSSSFSKYDPMEDQEEGQEEDQEFTEL
ncbi:MAG: hypothetical protein DHS80DRAFT_33943 [Piptocephalis tieghemiana]|nr:MAG: hypothetical protein DHS80DRAFT_33943 [Piptocephalis tieghemiana]